MRFSYRVALSFSIVLAIAFVVCLVSIICVQHIGGSLKKLYDHPLTVSNAVRDINIHINAIHRTMKDVASAENDEELFNAVERVTISDLAIHESFGIVKDRFLGDHAKLDAAYQVYVDWEPIRKEVIQLKSAGENDAATRITKGKGARHVDLLFERTKELTDFAQGKADEFYFATKRSENNSYIIFGAGIVLLVAFGSISVFWLSRSITNPISEFIRKLVRTMEKDGTLDLDFNRVSEQNIFDTTLLELEGAYKKLKNYNEELDKRVAERTEELRESNTRVNILNERFKKQNVDLAEAKLKAEESDRLKSAFLANMSHEIRTPMNAIIGFTELLDDQDVSEIDRKEYMTLIRGAGNQLLRLISDIVDLAKIDANQLSIETSPTHLKSFVEGVFKRFELSVQADGPSLIHNINLDPDVWAELDEQRVTQVLSNLLENSFKFTDHGHVELAAHIFEDAVQFRVTDTGIGISAKDQQTIFKRFQQAELGEDKLREGTGLGLSICKALVELMGGRIRIKSQLGLGSSFTISIPFHPCYSVENGHNPRKKIERDHCNRSVMIVEDEYTNRILLRAILESNDFWVYSANDGLDAVEQIRNGVSPDIILMDLKMPRMDGFEALNRIKEIAPKIPIVAQTAYAMANDRQKVMAAGFKDYISKPIIRDQLISKIEDLLREVAS